MASHPASRGLSHVGVVTALWKGEEDDTTPEVRLDSLVFVLPSEEPRFRTYPWSHSHGLLHPRPHSWLACSSPSLLLPREAEGVAVKGLNFWAMGVYGSNSGSWHEVVWALMTQYRLASTLHPGRNPSSPHSETILHDGLSRAPESPKHMVHPAGTGPGLRYGTDWMDLARTRVLPGRTLMQNHRQLLHGLCGFRPSPVRVSRRATAPSHAYRYPPADRARRVLCLHLRDEFNAATNAWFFCVASALSSVDLAPIL